MNRLTIELIIYNRYCIIKTTLSNIFVIPRTLIRIILNKNSTYIRPDINKDLIF